MMSRSSRLFALAVAFFIVMIAILAALISTSGQKNPLPWFDDVPLTIRIPKNVHEAMDSEGEINNRLMKGNIKINLCFEAPSGYDSSQWIVNLSLDGMNDTQTEPTQELGRNLCFEVEIPKDLQSGVHPLNGVLIDDFDGTQWKIPKQTFYFDSAQPQYQQLQTRMGEIIGGIGEIGIQTLLPDLIALGEKASAHHFPLLQVRLKLIAVYFLEDEGSETSLNQARRLLKSLPSWLDNPEFYSWKALALHEEAKLAMRPGGDFSEADQLLGEAESLLRRTLDPEWIGIRVTRSELMARMGNVTQAAQHLRQGLDACLKIECRPHFVDLASSQYGWLTLLNTEATHQQLREALDFLEGRKDSVLSSTTSLEGPNLLVNQAHLNVRLNQNPLPLIKEASRLLENHDPNNARVHLLKGWIQLIQAIHALNQGDHEEVLKLNQTLPNIHDPRLITRAWRCLGMAQRRSGDPKQALEMFEAALVYYESAYTPPHGLRTALGAGLRGDLFARAVRAAVDLERHDHAWRLMERMDALAVNEDDRRLCRETTTQPQLWLEIEENIRELLTERHELLTAPDRFLNKEKVKRVDEEIQLLRRQWPGCPQQDSSKILIQPDFRALPLDDEILLLHRDPDGQVRLERRTHIERNHIRSLLATIDEEGQTWPVEQWRRELEPLASALLPRKQVKRHTTLTFGLHGLLQNVPLTALPIPKGTDTQSETSRWFSDIATLALQPAGLSKTPLILSSPQQRPLFLIDPQNNLADLPGKRVLFGELFPDSFQYYGNEAGSHEFQKTLPTASWLHVDAHGVFNPIFPELSGIALSDGHFPLIRWEENPIALQFANLSACHSGRWPTTADSGRYGMAGMIARMGAAWVVASRGELNDLMARDFNQAFYRSIHAGLGVPQAWTNALKEIRNHWSPSQWSMLYLMQGREVLKK